MKVLMFGWEFPPHITGGLGTACAGIVRGLLDQDVTPLFVVPRLHGGEDRATFRLVNASEIPVPRQAQREWLHKLTYIEADADLVPYDSPAEFSGAAAVPGALEEKGNLSSPAGHVQYRFSGGYNRDLLKEVYRYALIAAEIAGTHPHEIIHAHDWLTFPAGIAARSVTGKPFIAHVHATEFDRSGENINRQVYEIEKQGMEEADHIIAVSGFTRQLIITRYGIPPGKVTVVHNGVSKNTFPAPAVFHKPAKKIVTFAGRITMQKGPEYFIEAAAKVLEKYPEVHFVMAGSGDLMQGMIRKA
ncbi:MAG TPA: glycosyltransferase, partial [Bacteroidia bacterium]|nr:glycosyltransferase [Bacteroidia bacterium]